MVCFTNYFSFLKLIPFFFSQNLNHRLIRTCQAGFTSSSFAPTERCCWTRAAITSSNYCVTGLCSQTFPCWETLWRVWRDTWKRLLPCHFLSVVLSAGTCWAVTRCQQISSPWYNNDIQPWNVWHVEKRLFVHITHIQITQWTSPAITQKLRSPRRDKRNSKSGDITCFCTSTLWQTDCE